MMACTDRHARYFLRRLSARTRLYTEMVTTGALIHGDRERFLGHDAAEHPLAIQLGGCKPADLARCATLAEERGYDEVNLNVGCPSERVRSGQFGAALMAEPQRVADCVAAMCAVVDVPVTVKCRIGIDHRDSYEHLADFVQRVSDGGCRTFIVHARKAWLNGLSPKENREIPPLRPDVVHRLADDFPTLDFVLNGGIRTMDAVVEANTRLDGAMVGREAYSNPWLLTRADEVLYGDTRATPDRAEVVDSMMDYAARHVGGHTRMAHIARHMLGLYQGVPGARQWRRTLSEQMHARDAGPAVLGNALAAAQAAAATVRQAA